MLIAVLEQRGDLGLLSLTAFLQTTLWGCMTAVYWIKRDQGKTSIAHNFIGLLLIAVKYYINLLKTGALDIWICSILAVAWFVGFVLFLIGQFKKGFRGGLAFRMMIYENALMVLGAALFFITAALAVSGRLVLLFSTQVDDLSGMLSFCMGSLLAYIALLLTSICLLVGRAAIA